MSLILMAVLRNLSEIFKTEHFNKADCSIMLCSISLAQVTYEKII